MPLIVHYVPYSSPDLELATTLLERCSSMYVPRTVRVPHVGLAGGVSIGLDWTGGSSVWESFLLWHLCYSTSYWNALDWRLDQLVLKVKNSKKWARPRTTVFDKLFLLRGKEPAFDRLRLLNHWACSSCIPQAVRHPGAIAGVWAMSASGRRLSKKMAGLLPVLVSLLLYLNAAAATSDKPRAVHEPRRSH